MIDTTAHGNAASGEDDAAQKLKAKLAAERSMQEYYDDCKFDDGVSSFVDFVQS